MTSTLDSSAGYVVLINTFTVEPDRAEELLAQLSEATEKVVRHRPGFVSANLYLGPVSLHKTSGDGCPHQVGRLTESFA